MTYHLCRDYQTNSNSNQSFSWSGLASMYVLAVFLRYVLGYTQVGETNFNLNAGPLLIAGSNSNFATVSFTGSVSQVTIPSSVYVPNAVNDVGRMIALKSLNNPTTNSGVFLITGVTGQTYTVSARIGTSGTLVAESGLSWYVMENDGLVTTGSTQANITYGFASILGFGPGYASNLGPTTTTVGVANYQGVECGDVVPNPLNVASTTGFPTSGSVVVVGIPLPINYTNITPTSFTGTSYGLGDCFNLNVPNGNGVYLNTNVNTATSYAGNGRALAPRIILQSPHATGWQVRLAFEPSSTQQAAIDVQYSIAPGFGGNSVGDFPVGGQCLHGGLYFNNNPSQEAPYGGSTVGPGAASGFTNGSRISIGGDDTGQAVVMMIRNVNNTNTLYTWAIFGIPDNEPTPLPPISVQRLFVISGGNTASNAGANYGIGFYFAPSQATGLGFGLDESLCSSGPSCWTQTFNGQNTNEQVSPMFSTTAGDNPFLGATELVPVDVVNGVLWNNAGLNGDGNGGSIFNQQPRTIGTMPWVRAGRSNFANWSTTTDSATTPAWMHFINGVYLQWGGPPPIP